MTAQERETDVPGTCWSIAGNQCTWSGCTGPNYRCEPKWISVYENKKWVKNHHCACHYRGVRQETWNGWNKKTAKKVKLRKRCIKFSRTACRLCSVPIGLLNPTAWFCRVVSCVTHGLCRSLKVAGSNGKSCAVARSLAEDVMMRDDADPREVESAKALMRLSCPRPRPSRPRPKRETCR